MSKSESRSSGSSKLKFVLLLTAIVLVVAGWSAVWLFGRSALDEQIRAHMTAMARSGVNVSCTDLSIGGYPFRYEVYCTDLNTETRTDSTGTLGGLVAVALVYKPWHVIFEGRSPAKLAMPISGLAADFSWKTARASVQTADLALTAFDAVIEEPEVRVTNALMQSDLSAEKAEFHLREVPELAAALEAFLTVDRLALPIREQTVLELDSRVHVRSPQATAFLKGADLFRVMELNDGVLRLEVVTAEVLFSRGSASSNGMLYLNGDGTLSGKLDVSLSNIDGLVEIARDLMPQGDTSLEPLLTVIRNIPATQASNDSPPAVNLELIIDRGTVRLGFLAVGVIPPLFQAGF